jgi:hypothetical protein
MPIIPGIIPIPPIMPGIIPMPIPPMPIPPTGIPMGGIGMPIMPIPPNIAAIFVALSPIDLEVVGEGDRIWRYREMWVEDV